MRSHRRITFVAILNSAQIASIILRIFKEGYEITDADNIHNRLEAIAVVHRTGQNHISSVAAAGLLGLDNVSAVKARGEDYAPGHGFDTVIARALAALPRLVEIAGHHVGEDGVFVALKGRYPVDELEQLELPWRHAVTELVVPGLEKGSRHAVLLRRQP